VITVRIRLLGAIPEKIIDSLLALDRAPAFHEAKMHASGQSLRSPLTHLGDGSSDVGNDLRPPKPNAGRELAKIDQRLMVFDFTNSVERCDGLGAALRSVPLVSHLSILPV
jgi:hypothetical protein